MGIIIAIHVQFTSKDTHVKTHVNHSTGYDISEATLPSFPLIVQLDCPLVTIYNSKMKLSCRGPGESILNGQESGLRDHSQSLLGDFRTFRLRLETRPHPITLASSSVRDISPIGLRLLLDFHIIMGDEAHMIF